MDYSYIRETLNKDLFNNYVLSIQLDPDGFSFYICHQESINRPLYFSFRRFEIPGIDSLIRELKEFSEYDNNPFHKTIIIYNTSKFCIIPDEFYKPDHLTEYIKLSHPVSDKEIIYSSDIQEINTKVLFCIPEDLNTVLNLKFPNAIVLHSACIDLNFGIKKSGKTCLINRFGTLSSIAVFDNSELKLYNIFSIHDEIDLVYYLFNSLKSCNQKASEIVCFLAGISKEDSEKNILLSKYISNPVYYQPELIDVNISDFPVNMLFNHLEAFSCVL